MPRDVRALLYDLTEACRAIEGIVSGTDLDAYVSDRMIRSSVEREFIVIGEALRRAAQIDPSIEDAVGDYARIVGFRNNLVHQYEKIDDEVVWTIATESVPTLRELGERLIQERS